MVEFQGGDGMGGCAANVKPPNPHDTDRQGDPKQTFKRPNQRNQADQQGAAKMHQKQQAHKKI